MTGLEYATIAKSIDHAALSPAQDARALDHACEVAIAYDVASFCVVPHALSRMAARLRGTGVKASTTIGFPHGSQRADVKLFELARALDDGCEEADVVLNISHACGNDFDAVSRELAPLVAAAHARGARIKVIFETAFLSSEQKVALCHRAAGAGVDWVKTSTGFAAAGATVEDVRLMRAHVPATVQVKASGGVKDLDAVLALRAAGASRVGCSRTREILDELRRRCRLPPVSVAAP